MQTGAWGEFALPLISNYRKAIHAQWLRLAHALGMAFAFARDCHQAAEAQAVMATDDTIVRALADAIDDYLGAHPQAADSAEGIQVWWLAPPLNQEPLTAVVAALEDLERRGIVSKTMLEHGRVIFRKARPNH